MDLTVEQIARGDRFIRARPSEFMGTEDVGMDGLMADLLGGVGGEVAYCEDCTQEGGQWKLETCYGDEDDDG
jgi:hypothetical protein